LIRKTKHDTIDFCDPNVSGLEQKVSQDQPVESQGFNLVFFITVSLMLNTTKIQILAAYTHLFLT
jgi:hypothetical protein